MTEQQGTGAGTDAPARRTTYDVAAVQEKWRPVWEKLNPFQAADDGSKPRRYALTMFPYPSGDLHMGHAEVMAIHDVLARHWRQLGYDVLNPIGWDSFGLPAENAAIKRDEHPATFTYANIETQAESFRRYAISFDWSRRLHTSDPDYYRWTQWLFLRFRERGLAYRKHSPVNWCPVDQTVLANEQVVQGMCERCGAEVTKRELSQWYFKVTDYAQRLLDDMVPLEGRWPERVLAMQRNWIGRSPRARTSTSRSSVRRRSRTVGRACRDPVASSRPRRSSLSRPRGPSPSSPPGPTPCTARRSSWWPRTRSWPRRSSPTSTAPRWRPTWRTSARPPTSTGWPPTARRPGCSWACTRSTPSTASGSRCGRPTTCSPTTAPARSWRCRRTTSATSTSRRRSTCRCVGWSTRGSPTRRRPTSRPAATAPTSTPPATASASTG